MQKYRNLQEKAFISKNGNLKPFRSIFLVQVTVKSDKYVLTFTQKAGKLGVIVAKGKESYVIQMYFNKSFQI